MFKFIADILAEIYKFVPSYGGAIMLLTLAIMVVLTPLTLKGTRSMLAMQRLQPELRKLQVKYKDDREKLNQEMMAFYKENNINPVGGCLPLLIQMPVFFVLYRVLFGLTRRAPYGYDIGSAYGMDIADQGTYESFGHFDPEHLDRGDRLYRDLSSTNEMSSFGMDLAESAQKILSTEGFLHALPYIVLVLVVAATSYIQQKQVSGRQQNSGGPPNPMNQQQQMLLKIMPLFFVFISFTLPAGIVLYFVVSNLYRVGQQAFITRTMYSDHSHGSAVIETTATETKAPGPGGIKGFLASFSPPKELMPDPKGAKRKATKSAGVNRAGGQGKNQTKGGVAKSTGSKSSGAKNAAGRTSGAKNGTRGQKGQPAGGKGTAANAKGAAAAAKGAAATRTGGTTKRTNRPANSSTVTKQANDLTKSPTADEDTSAGQKGASPAATSKGQAPSRQQRPANPRSQPRKKRK
jgi:YidC/Oxa1 family membrane protein insertase